MILGTPIYINEHGWRDCEPWTVIDGKQRLTAIQKFMAGEVGAAIDGRVVYFCEIAEFRRWLPCIRFNIVELDKLDAMRFYVILNSGVAHTADELERVRQMIELKMGVDQ